MYLLNLKRQEVVKFVISYKTTKLTFFTKSSVVQRFVCPSYSSSYTNKTERTLFKQTKGRGYPNKNKSD